MRLSLPATSLWLAALALLFLGSHASAQTPARSFGELQPVLTPGQTVIVTDKKGAKTTGGVVSILGSQLEIGDRRRRLVFDEDSVRRIQKADSDWDGVIIGGAIGLVLGWAVVATCKNEFTHTHQVTYDCASVGGLLPAGVGWLGGKVDGMIHKSLFVSPQRSAVSLAPLIGGGRIGITATIDLRAGVHLGQITGKRTTQRK